MEFSFHNSLHSDMNNFPKIVYIVTKCEKNDSICSLHFQYFLEKESNILATKTVVMYQ